MQILSAIGSFISASTFVWLPILLGIAFFHMYQGYRRNWYLANKMKYVMLNINIPKDVFKSPEAMEIVIDVLHHMGGGAMDWRHRFWNGAVLHWSSLEIASIEGSIYFFIRTTDKLADLVTSAIYSQYPNAEVNQVDDYTKYVPDYNLHHDRWALYGADFKLAEADYLPIKTYVDYGLDKSVGSLEEEQKIDPITSILEFFGTIRAGEQIWLQFVVRADPFSAWRKDAKERIKEIMASASGSIDEENPVAPLKLTHGDQEEIKAIQRSLKKLGFEVFIRAIYIARNENENPGVVGFFKNPVFKAFNYWNSIRKDTDVGVDWVWEDITGMRDLAVKKRFFNDYVERAGFEDSFSKYLNFLWFKRKKPMVLTSEELATLFHIPGRVSETVTLERIEATKSEAPTNLPV
ncbi:hypothetical protein KC929_00815 [Patescibacteria group bacterium]|nr:hypothetical protein [Patescibacteria group bacterium]